VFLAVAGVLLWAEHEAHILGYLPLILILGMGLARQEEREARAEFGADYAR
jgi:protein-S-isoprenylcysteine O-methyltransferase Ste14